MTMNKCPFCKREFEPNCGARKVNHIRTCEKADPIRGVDP